ncbi:MAG: transglycosylase SLT domain-containing protein, partial [Geobacteraceae bacterium]|nr:transglycosylase SLT domain-containing protein [Geobacteraceae bacterium]
LPPEDQSLRLSAERLKKKEYSGARVAALQAQPGPKRDFVLGVTAYHLEKWDEAERYLATSAECFPLLRDFALYYRAIALTKLSRPAEALPPLQRLKQEYPDSPFVRSATLLMADILFQMEDFQKALISYQTFLADYPSGNDSLKAQFQSALCREKIGDLDGAIQKLRGIWLSYPAKSVAGQAESELDRLRKSTETPLLFTEEELYKRGCTLFEQHHYKEAATVFSALSPDSLPKKLLGEIAFKIAMTHYRLKRNAEAEQSFVRLASPESPYPEYRVDATYWLAQVYDRIGKDNEAVNTFLGLAEAHPESPLADNALFQAALIRKHEGAHREALALFRKVFTDYPGSSYAPRSLWESAWSLYLSGDFAEASNTFALLSNDPAWREKALYWQARALEASRPGEAAFSVYAEVQQEYPTGFYSMNIVKKFGIRSNRIPILSTSYHVPLPDTLGMERAQTLIALGLYEEASRELAALKKRNSSSFRGSLRHAGLYLSMNDYRSAMGLFKQEALVKEEGNSPSVWAILYPAAFHDIVSRHTSNAGIDECITYALIRAESNFLPTARSPVGALGLMQLMPATAREIARNLGNEASSSQLTNPEVNVRIGTLHLKDLIHSFNGNLVSAVAAYNAGSTPVRRWRKNFPTLQEDEFIENIPYPETREYVKKVLAAMEVYRQLYGLKESTNKEPPASSIQEKFSSTTTTGQPAKPASPGT